MRDLKEQGPTIKLTTPSGGGSIDSEAVEAGVKKVSEGLGEVERAVLKAAEEARGKKKEEALRFEAIMKSHEMLAECMAKTVKELSTIKVNASKLQDEQLRLFKADRRLTLLNMLRDRHETSGWQVTVDDGECSGVGSTASEARLKSTTNGSISTRPSLKEESMATLSVAANEARLKSTTYGSISTRPSLKEESIASLSVASLLAGFAPRRSFTC